MLQLFEGRDHEKSPLNTFIFTSFIFDGFSAMVTVILGDFYWVVLYPSCRHADTAVKMSVTLNIKSVSIFGNAVCEKRE